jgi:hypothetical protein
MYAVNVAVIDETIDLQIAMAIGIFPVDSNPKRSC